MADFERTIMGLHDCREAVQSVIDDIAEGSLSDITKNSLEAEQICLDYLRDARERARETRGRLQPHDGLQPFRLESSDTITAACIIAGAIILVHFLR